MNLRLTLTALFAALLAACATPQGPDASRAFRTFEPETAGTEIGTFKRVFVAPVRVTEQIEDRIDYRPRRRNDPIRPISQADIDGRTERLERNLREALQGRVELVDAPADGVLTIAVVITEMEANRPTLAELSAEPSLDIRSVYSPRVAAKVTFSEGERFIATGSNRWQMDIRESQFTAAIWGDTDRFLSTFANSIGRFFI